MSRPPCPLWAKLIATGFGVGYIPFAPGTFGSLAAVGILFGYKIVISMLHLVPWCIEKIWPDTPIMFIIFLLALYIALGIPAATRFAKSCGLHDPKAVVIDEFAGQTLAIVPVSLLLSIGNGPMLCYSGLHRMTPVAWLVGFAAFRLFDIWKPWPIRRLERFPGGLGIMLDDLAAGLIAGLLLLALTRMVPSAFCYSIAFL